MRGAAFAILCCALQHVTSEIIEDKIHNIFNDRNKYETKNVSTSDEFDVDQKTGTVIEKQTVYTEFVANGEDCDDVVDDDVKIMTLFFKKDAKGRERIYEEDTIIKKVSKPNADSTGKGQNSESSDKDISTSTKTNSDENSTAKTPATSVQNKTADSQNYVINLIASKPSIVIINDEAENTSSTAPSGTSGNTGAGNSGSGSGTKGSPADESPSEDCDEGQSSEPNVYGQDYGERFYGQDNLYPQNIVIVNENDGSSGSDSSPSRPSSKDTSEKKPADVASRPSAAGSPHGYKNRLGPDGVYIPYGSQVPSIKIENKNKPGSPETNSGSGSGTKGSPADASPSEDRNEGELSGPNNYGQDYYGDRFFGQDNLYPQNIVIVNENDGSSGSDSSPSRPSSKDTSEKKPADVASRPSAAGSPHGYKNRLGPDGVYIPYGSQVPTIKIENKNKPGSPETNFGSGSGTKGSPADASPSEDRNEGELSGPNVYGQDYYGDRFFGQDNLYPQNIVIVNENDGSSRSDSSPKSPSSKDSAEKKPANAASKPSAAGSPHGYKNRLGPDGIYRPYGRQVPSIKIENKNKPGPPETNSGSGSGTKGSPANESPSEDCDEGQSSVPNVYGRDYYGKRFFGQDDLYPQNIVIVNENDGSSGSDSSPSSPSSEDTSEKKPADVASRPSAAGSPHGYKNRLGPDGVYIPYGSQVPSIKIENKNKPGSPETNSGSGSGTKSSPADASPSEDRNEGELSGPNVYGQDYYGDRFFGHDNLYPQNIVIVNENDGSSRSNSSPKSPSSKDSAEKKPANAASKPSAAGSPHGYKNRLGPDGIYRPYGRQVPSIKIENKNKPGSPETNSGSGSGTKGSPADESPSEDYDEGQSSVTYVYGREYYGKRFFGQDDLYPQNIVIVNENDGSLGLDSSPSSSSSEDTSEKKPANVASRPSAAGSPHGYKNRLGPDGVYIPYGSQVPSIKIENKNKPGPPVTNSGSGSGTKGSPADESPSEDCDEGQSSEPNVYGQDYYGERFYGQDNLYPQNIVIVNENDGSSGSDSSPSRPSSKDTSEKKPADVASRPSAAGSPHGYKNRLGPDGVYIPYGSQVPSIKIENKNKPGSPETTSGSGSGTKGSPADASPSEDRNEGELSGPNVYGQDYYGDRFFGQDNLYPQNIVIVNENDGSSRSDSSPKSPSSKDSAEKKPANAASKPSAAGSPHGYKNRLRPDGIYRPYGRQVPSIKIENKNKPGSPETNSGSGSGTKGSPADESPSEDCDEGESSVPNAYGREYYGKRFFGQDDLYPQNIVIVNENDGFSGSDSSPSRPSSKDTSEKKPADVASRPSAAGSPHGYKNRLGPDGVYIPYGSQVPSIKIENKNKPGSPETNSGSGSGTKGSPADASPSEDRNEGELSGPNVYGQDYYGDRFFGQDNLYPQNIVIVNENDGSSRSDSSPKSSSSKDSAEKKPANAASKPSAAGSPHGYKNRLRPDGIYRPYGRQVPSIKIENKNKPGSPETNSGSGSGTKGSPADESPSEDCDKEESSVPNFYGRDYYGKRFFGQDDLYPQNIVIVNENDGSSGSDSSPSSPSSEDTSEKKPADVASRPSAAGRPHGYKNRLGPDGVYIPYGSQVPSIKIENKNKSGPPRTNSGSGSGSKGSPADESPSEDCDEGESSVPNDYGRDYYEKRFFGQDNFYLQKIVILNESDGSSGSDSSPKSPSSKDTSETKTADVASRPSAAGSPHGYKNRLGPDGVYIPYGSQEPSIKIDNKNKPGSPETNSGSGSGTKGSPADASPSEDRNEGELSGPNVYGQDYYRDRFFGQDNLYPQNIVIVNENDGSSRSDSSPKSPSSKDSAEKKPADAASKPSAAGSPHGYKKRLGPAGIYRPYGRQVPSIKIENKNKPESPETNSGSGSGTKGSPADESPSEDCDEGESSVPNVYLRDYFGKRFFGQDDLYPQNIVILNENDGSSRSDSSPKSPSSKDSAEKKPADAASKPSAAGSPHGYKNRLGPDGIYRPYGRQVPSIKIEHKNKPGPPETNSGSGSGTKGSPANESPSEDCDEGQSSVPNVYGRDYYGKRFFGQDDLYPQNIVILNENDGSSRSDSSPKSPSSKDSAEKKPADAASKPSAAGSPQGYKNRLGPDGIYRPYGRQVPSIKIENKNKPGPPETNSGSGSGTKGSPADESPSEDCDEGESSVPNVYGRDNYRKRFFGQGDLYPQKIVILNENDGSSGSDSSPSSPSSKETPEKKPADVASRPSAAGSPHGYKNRLGPDGVYIPYGSQVPSIKIENKNKPGSPGTSGNTGAYNSGRGSGLKGSEADASPSEDHDTEEISSQRIKRIRHACKLRRRQYSIRLGRKGQSCEGC